MPAKRPLTFCFNGGPGSASMWVHMGGMGPRSPKLMPNGGMPPPPYQLKDNQDTWLDKTDLVFIDPVGTGYSRAKTVGSGAAHERRGRATFNRWASSFACTWCATAASFRRCSSPAKATARSAPPAWPDT